MTRMMARTTCHPLRYDGWVPSHVTVAHAILDMVRDGQEDLVDDGEILRALVITGDLEVTGKEPHEHRR